MEKIVVTGIGSISALGLNTDELWEGLISGKSGVKQITRIPLDKHDTTIAAEVDDAFEEVASKYWKKRQLSATTKATRMGLAAAGEAIEDCGADFSTLNTKRIAIIFGVSDNSYEDGELDIKPNTTLKRMPSAIPAMLAMKHGIQGATFNVSTACASSGYAVTLGKQLIQSGMYDMVITGGLSNTVSNVVISGFNQVLAMSVDSDPTKTPRPFTKNRDGFIMGEGSGCIIIESEKHAKARGARIYCELAGASMTCEAYNMTAPKTDGEGMAEAMEIALSDAGMSPDDIGYINAHGTSTSLNDLYETMAIKKVFGKRAYDIPVSSIKAAIGHTLAAGGALEGIACIKAIETGILPPTVHYGEPDPELDLNYIPNEAIKKDIKAAISNSFGFGGNNSTLIFKKYE